MATHSSILAWRILGKEEPGGLPSTGSHRVRHDWSDLVAAAAALLKIRVILWYTYESPVYESVREVIAFHPFLLRTELAYSSGSIQSWFAGLSEVLTLLTSLLLCKDINVFSSAFCSLISTILTSLVECFQLFRNVHIPVKETVCSMLKIQYPSCVNLFY